MPSDSDDRFSRWLAAAERRYLADLTRPELGRALRALSSCYVERRGRLAEGGALGTAGKRAAFALFYAPLHFLAVREIARSIQGGGSTPPLDVVDLGCGTGAAGAAWALERGVSVQGRDTNSWAVREAAWTYRTLGLEGRALRESIDRLVMPQRTSTLLCAFLINELTARTRGGVLARLLAAAERGHELLIVEPIARRLTPWWPEWEGAVAARGGAAQEWRFRLELPPLLRDLDRAAGLSHRELTARTLHVLPSHRH